MYDNALHEKLWAKSKCKNCWHGVKWMLLSERDKEEREREKGNKMR